LWAAGLAGYAAINVAAMLAACELGIQPLLFKDASGAPLYAPYALHIAIPAMMLGHLTFAGLADLFVAGGVVAYLQRTNPALLGQKSAGGATKDASPAEASGWRTTRPLWIRLALLMLLTPLGILAAGTAWGEWGAKDFSDPLMPAANRCCLGPGRASVRTAAGVGPTLVFMERAFSPVCSSFVRHPAFGYVMSAMFGCGLILGFFLFVGWMIGERAQLMTGLHHDPRREKISRGVVGRSLASFVDALEHAFYAEESAKKNGLLQKLDPRIKIAAVFPLIVIAALARRLG
jgi:cobalt/nickel transport system permease protein